MPPRAASLSFDEGMAKINTTAQLSQTELSNLEDRLAAMGVSAGADLVAVPDAYEKNYQSTQ